MAAVVTHLHPQPAPERLLRLAPAPSDRPVLRPSGRPSLTVLDGGRSATVLRRRATYRRRRVVALVVLVAAVIVLSRLVPAVFDAMTTPPTASSPTADLPISGPSYVAQAGDTLWDVARSLPAGGDIRDRVDRLADVNGSASVVAGQTLRIPADMLAS